MAKFKFRDFFPQSENYFNSNSKVSNETKKLANTLKIFKNTVEFRKLATGLIFFNGPFFKGLIFGGAYIWRGFSTEENLRFKIDWASLIVGSEFTVFALFYFVFEGNFPSTSPRGAYI